MSCMSPPSNPYIPSRSLRSRQYARHACFLVARQILGNIDAEYIAEVGIIFKLEPSSKATITIFHSHLNDHL